MKKIILYMCLPLLLVSLSCVKESEGVIRGKLDVVLADDMAAIVEDVEAASLLDKPYYEVLEYGKYDDDPSFIRRAVVDFYFMKTVNAKVTRKYRYIKSMGMWDRYYNKYYMFTPEPNETEN